MLNKSKNTWIFFDGFKSLEFPSFPFAFRNLHFAYKQGITQKKSPKTMADSFYIKSPLGKIYKYHAAVAMAEDQGLLSTDGIINKKEFKNR